MNLLPTFHNDFSSSVILAFRPRPGASWMAFSILPSLNFLRHKRTLLRFKATFSAIESTELPSTFKSRVRALDTT